MKKIVLVSLFVLCLAAPAAAQTSVPAGQPITIAFESEHGPAVMAFRAKIDGTVVKTFTNEELTITDAPLDQCREGAVRCRTYQVQIPALAEGGPYALTVEAFNDLGVAESGPLSLLALPIPQPPGTPRRIVIEIPVNDDGTLDLNGIRVTMPEGGR